MGRLQLKDKIALFPDASGVYIFKDAQGTITYVGKAKSLKKRVQSYFGRFLSLKTQALLSKVADIEYRITSSESQAQLLEASIIKDKQPQYNISLKDDKSFPLVKITDEPFPLVTICRRKKPNIKDRALYFGPYTNVRLLRQAIKAIRRIFGFRSCKTMPKKICLYGRLKLCPAPCVGRISSDEYKEIIKNIILILDSRYTRLLDKLSLRMKEAAVRQDFEQAAAIRDQFSALAAIMNTGSVGSLSNQLEDLKNLLRLDKLPERIEAFDISNISGKEACGSLVSFYRAEPDKNNYRRFRIKTVGGIDDYKMLAEVVRRRYTRVIEENLPLPDLILIDGGRAHLLVAERELKNLGLRIPLVSIAKDRENIYCKDKSQPIKFTSDAPALNLIRRIRDEAHRFAVAYHHVLRRRKIIGK